MQSFADYLQPLVPFLPDRLISRRALADIEAVCRWLPGRLAYNTFGFECRLGQTQPRADLLLSATIAQGGRDTLARLDDIGDLSAPLLAHPTWQRVHHFACQWANPASPLYRGVDTICFDFDVATDAPGAPVPGVFFHPQALDPCDPAHSRSDLTPDEYLNVTMTATELLSGRPNSAPLLRTLATCFAELPAGAQVFQVGLMLSRPDEAVRLCINGLTQDTIMDYLARVQWPGPIDDLRVTLSRLAPQVDAMDLAIDVGDAVRPKIGLECVVQGTMHSFREPNWPSLLAFLVAQGLCTDQKRAGLIAYPGYSGENAGGAAWPADLRHSSQPVGRGVTNLLVRALHHVKIVYQPEQPLQAKAYLAAMYRWFPINTTAAHTSQLQGVPYVRV